MEGNKVKKGFLSSAFKKAVLGVTILASAAAFMPATASAQTVSQAQEQVQIANVNAQYINAETALQRSTDLTDAQYQVRDQQIRAQFNFEMAQIHARFGDAATYQQPPSVDQPTYMPAPTYQAPAPVYQAPPQTVYVQPNNGNNVVTDILGTAAAVVIGHAIFGHFDHDHHDGGRHDWGRQQFNNNAGRGSVQYGPYIYPAGTAIFAHGNNHNNQHGYIRQFTQGRGYRR